jgi:pimeloyl-ACP methyl ester carboxylesterase
MLTKWKDFARKVKGSVDDQSIAFILRNIFARCPSPPSLDPTPITLEKLQEIRLCAQLAKMVYIKPRRRRFHAELGTPLFASTVSDIARIPFLVINHAKLNRIFVSCRGSYCIEDFVVDAAAQPVEWIHQGVRGFVHSGVYRTAQNLYRTLKNYIVNLSYTHGNRPITMVGHSLGAAVACICAEFFADDFPQIEINSIVFAPVAAFTQNLSELAGVRCSAYSVDGDFVPFLSLYNFESLPPGVLPDIIVKWIRAGIKKRLERSEANPYGPTWAMPMYPPCKSYLLTFADGGRKAAQFHEVTDICIFGALANNLNELRHQMSAYMRWINEYGGVNFGIEAFDLSSLEV